MPPASTPFRRRALGAAVLAGVLAGAGPSPAPAEARPPKRTAKATKVRAEKKLEAKKPKAPAGVKDATRSSTTAGADLAHEGWRPPVGPPPPPTNKYSKISPAALKADLAKHRKKSGSEADLLERVTRGLLGASYQLSPLGEGEGAPPDPDPRFRLDAFDCMTFVETALALAHGTDPDTCREVLDEIRYHGGAQTFETRRHFILGQWITALEETGWIEDVTEEVGGEDTRWVEFTLDETRWKKRRIARSLALDAGEVPLGTHRLPYIPIEKALERIDAIPAGTILDVVREDVPWSPVIITHQALVLTWPDKAKTKIVRHASPVARRVVDETLDHMLRRYLRPRPWRVIGVHLLRIKSAAPSLAVGEKK